MANIGYQVIPGGTATDRRLMESSEGGPGSGPRKGQRGLVVTPGEDFTTKKKKKFKPTSRKGWPQWKTGAQRDSGERG